jgi:cobyrinic acid a,c-diamide synthase
MAGILPIECQMQDGLASLGYREDESGLKGHEYHHSKRANLADLPKAYSLSRGDEGMVLNNLRASYIHWYFESAPEVVAGLFRKEMYDA